MICHLRQTRVSAFLFYSVPIYQALRVEQSRWRCQTIDAAASASLGSNDSHNWHYELLLFNSFAKVSLLLPNRYHCFLQRDIVLEENDLQSVIKVDERSLLCAYFRTMLTVGVPSTSLFAPRENNRSRRRLRVDGPSTEGAPKYPGSPTSQASQEDSLLISHRTYQERDCNDQLTTDSLVNPYTILNTLQLCSPKTGTDNAPRSYVAEAILPQFSERRMLLYASAVWYSSEELSFDTVLSHVVPIARLQGNLQHHLNTFDLVPPPLPDISFRHPLHDSLVRIGFGWYSSRLDSYRDDVQHSALLFVQPHRPHRIGFSDIIMSDLKASVDVTSNGFAVSGHEQINYKFQFVDNIFDISHNHLADVYRSWKRVLLVSDATVSSHYSAKWEAYFKHHNINLTTFIMAGGEKNKTMTTMLSIVDAMNDFGLVRKEPVLVVGGGLCTDVTGYACASYRRTTNFIRVPTTLIGLIDASVSIKVAVNHGNLKNRLGAYHAPMITFLDFNMLRTLPEGQVRNGFAELMKISSCADKRIWDLLVRHGEALIETRFGRIDDASAELKAVADEICWRGIKVMLDLESPNLHELGLDRVIAFGHSLSPTLELTPVIPLRHGHAINIDMAYFITFAWHRGYLTEAERDEYHALSHRVGLSMDHELFTEDLIVAGTEAIMKTRDNKQRFAVPNPYGSCAFINDASYDELFDVLKKHKALIKEKYGSGNGKEAFVDYGDLGMDPEILRLKAAGKDHAVAHGKEITLNGHTDAVVVSASVNVIRATV
ncbi:hypothetical protein NM688_g2612 [Phlebia brevispora]|uniref:Uncharacterized protein n=1 Tax=Phlebia brevispora TaxID=194682 RepID=A0ACC1T805_9APHY|nr:hypothetical protein NM688_g2612 [Phlebia brevispora]